MTKYLFMISLIVSCSIFCFAQNKKSSKKKGIASVGNAKKSTKLNTELASVYIKVEGDGEFTSDRTKETYDITWFRIYSNFKDVISFCAYDLSVSPTGKIGLHYEIEKAPDGYDSTTRNNENIPRGFPHYDFCDRYNLRSGKSFLFGVPKSHLIENSRIKIQFFYSWEDEFISNEPKHYVLYYHPYFRTEK